MSTPASPLVTSLDGPAVERQVAFDMVRRAALAAPILLLVTGLIWGTGGALSAAYATGLVLVNLAASAMLLGWAARISLALLAGVALFGYVLRLAVVTGAVLAVINQGWVEPVPLGLTLIVAHLGLLVWETRYVSASLAFPALRPSRKD